jgi:glycosyltransferase involved in cell wall biosynthesis
MKIGVLMMVKNEQKRILVSLESIKTVADFLIIYDTGSIDNTIQLIKDFCEKNDIILRLKIGEFVNFSTSRNVCLDFADTFLDVDYLLLMDVNDELKLKKRRDFINLCKDHLKNDDHTAFLICQEWWSGEMNKYYNTRLIKPHCGWRYKGSVHEWLEQDLSKSKYNEKKSVLKVPEKYNIILYQDRTQDDDKSSKRFIRDEEILLKEHLENPKETRTVFYLAQTYSCLNRNSDAFYYYKKRAKLEGFQEEKFHSLLRIGDLSLKLKLDWSDTMGWYMKAFEHSKRAEPLINIVDHYKDKDQWDIAYMFCKTCCELEFPSESILFVDRLAYDYKRWHQLGIVSYYCKKYKDGKMGCLKALECKPSSEIDKNNLKYYLDKNCE